LIRRASALRAVDVVASWAILLEVVYAPRVIILSSLATVTLRIYASELVGNIVIETCAISKNANIRRRLLFPTDGRRYLAELTCCMKLRNPSPSLDLLLRWCWI